jgi:Lrp/AsnC family leucine-responsive transcriptional regulator
VLAGFHADIDLAVLGRPLTLLSDIRLREGADRREFEQGLSAVPQVVSAVRITGEYDYELRTTCADSAEFGAIIQGREVRDLGCSSSL